jgi:tripartite-type tricarboxylate transporter receptor subunit TctC
MTRNRRSMKSTVILLLGAIAAAMPFSAMAQGYPSKPLRLVIGFPPGGGADIVGRQIAPRLGDLLGQPVVIDNRPGAGANIALELVAKQPPDGYTLMLTTPTIAVNPGLYPKVGYDSVRDFSPVALMASTVYMLVVHPSLPVKSVKELVALAKARPRQLNYSTGGNGAAAHLAGELFRSMAGIQIVHVPFKGIAPALVAVLSGEAQLTFASQPSSLSQVKAGKLRALAVTSLKRSPFTPDLPSIAEAGLPGYDTTAWYGIIAPAKTPPAIVKRLNEDVARVLEMPEVKTGLANRSFQILGGSPDEFGAFIKAELAKWGKVVKEAGMRID